MQKIDDTNYHLQILDQVVGRLAELGFTQQGSSLEFRRELGGRLGLAYLDNSVCQLMRDRGYEVEWIISTPSAVGPTMGAAESLGATLLGVQFVRRQAE